VEECPAASVSDATPVDPSAALGTEGGQIETDVPGEEASQERVSAVEVVPPDQQKHEQAQAEVETGTLTSRAQSESPVEAADDLLGFISNGESPALRDIEPASPVTAIFETPISEPVEVRPEREVQHPADILWSCVDRRRAGLAYHVARVVECSREPDPAVPHSTLAKAAAVGFEIALPYGEMARVFQETVNQLETSLQEGYKWPVQSALLAIAASIRPALIAPGTAASWLLRDALRSIATPGLRSYVSSLVEFSDRGHALAPNALKDVKDKASAQKELTDLQGEVRLWRSRAASYTCLLERATDVWRHWLLGDSIISRLLDPIETHDVGRTVAVSDLVAQYSDKNEISRLVDNTDRHQLGVRPGRPIEARALRQLQSRLTEAIKLASRWLNVAGRLPRTGVSTTYESDIRAKVKRVEPDAISELKGLAATADSATRAGARCLLASIYDLAEIFDPKVPFATTERPIARLLSEDLLLNASISLDENWMPEVSDGTVAEIGKIAVMPTGPDWGTVFRGHLAAGNLDSADRVLKCIESQGQPVLNEPLELRRVEVQRWREKLGRAVEQTCRKIDAAVALSLIGEQEHTLYKGEAEAIEVGIDRITNFRRAFGCLTRIEEALAVKSQSHLESARRRFSEQMAGQENTPEYARIAAR
jgi:hypothetical protein